MRRTDHQRDALALLAALAATGALVGCGSGSKRVSTSSAAGVPVTVSASVPARVDAVAAVAGKPISKASYEHWLSVEQALGVTAGAGPRALGYLITAIWVEDEARALGVSTSHAQARARLTALARKSFPGAGGLSSFLSRSHESEADLLGRVREELLQTGIASHVAGAAAGTQRADVLASFQQGFQQRWKSRTTCEHALIMEDCSEYRGPPAAPAGAPAPSTGPPPSTSSGRSPSAPSSVVVQPGGGGITITSPAFERDGAVPARYTCDGANISPPLSWHGVPAKAGALVLFVIDTSTVGSAGGVRWMVADIDPAATGVAAGATPQGGIVGADTQGTTGYGGICPAHGQTSTIEFALFALQKRIPLTPGFQPALAEHEYAAARDLLGRAAVTYAVYHRP